MAKIMKSYKVFLNEELTPPTEEVNQPGPQRKFSKENKYKFQMEYDKDIEDKLMEYNFTFFTPDDNVEKDENKNFIIIDILNLTYSFDSDENSGIRMIDDNRLKTILDNL